MIFRYYNNITTLSLEKGIFVGIPGADRVDDDVAPQRGGADVGDSEQIRSHPTRLPACLCLAACWRAYWLVKGDKKKSEVQKYLISPILTGRGGGGGGKSDTSKVGDALSKEP